VTGSLTVHQRADGGIDSLGNMRVAPAGDPTPRTGSPRQESQTTPQTPVSSPAPNTLQGRSTTPYRSYRQAQS